MNVWLRRLLLLVGASVVAVALGWIALYCVGRFRAAGPRPPFHPGRADPTFGWVLMADFHARHLADEFDVDVRTNSFAHRGGPREVVKPPGVRRVVLVGDSFSFGWGVPEDAIFAVLLEQQLAAHSKGGVEVINCGVPGWNIAAESIFLRDVVYHWQPDLVLLQLCSNDFKDFFYMDLELDGHNLPVAIHGRGRFGDDLRQRLMEKAAGDRGLTLAQLAEQLSQSQLDDLVAEGVRAYIEERRAGAGAPPQGPIAALSADEVRRGLDTGTEFQARYLRYVVEDIAARLAARGVPLRVLSIDVNSPTGDEDGPALAALCADLGARCLSSTTFIPPSDARACFFGRDPHWRAEGHRRAAEALAAWILEDHELPFGD